MKEQHVVIMAGGVGARLWPMSVATYPKQFVDVMGTGKSLIQLTVERFLPLCPITNVWIVTNILYVDIVKEQLPDIPNENILLEPEPRNTAPCIAYACWKIAKKHPNAAIIVTPSDAIVLEKEKFVTKMLKALTFIENNDVIVTIGIKPNRPETGYGYIKVDKNVASSNVYKVDSFKEKPNLELAKHYVHNNHYLWNAGIFIWKTNTILEAIRKYTPDLATTMDLMKDSFFTDEEEDTVNKYFPTCQKISIDYAIMEKSDNIYTIPADFGWSDLGSWNSLHYILPNDEKNNTMVGNNINLVNCKNCIVHTSESQKVILEGLDGYIVVQQNHRLLICRLSEEQRIKEFI